MHPYSLQGENQIMTSLPVSSIIQSGHDPTYYLTFKLTIFIQLLMIQDQHVQIEYKICYYLFRLLNMFNFLTCQYYSLDMIFIQQDLFEKQLFF